MAAGNSDRVTGNRCSFSSGLSSLSSMDNLDDDSSSKNCFKQLLNRHGYSSSETEAIYRVHTYPAEHASLRNLIILMIALDVTIAIVNLVFLARLSVENISNIVLSLFYVLLLVFLHTRFMSSRHLATVSFVVVLLCLCFAATSFPVSYQAKENRKQATPPLPPAEGVWRLAYVIFVIYAFIPLRIYVALVVGFLLPLAHSLTSIFVASSNEYPMLLWRQITANIIIFLSVNVVGMFCYDRREKLRRHLFDAVRTSVSEQLLIQESNDRMEKLLLCILPPHVAMEMKADLRRPHLREIFPKAYIQRHECVSIIFANILGLTSLSTQCSPHDLMRLLNELFGRFDQLALEHHCMRIHLLGSCYYGICGLPDPRPDHAKCCIEMGLDMIDVISFLRESTDCNVHLRVGVHTGHVIAGVVGLRRWKFDVWGDDVELAHSTEQAGLRDRVLVTQATVDHLQGEFPVEPGHGEQRSARIKAKALSTYLIIADQPRKRYGPVTKSGGMSHAPGRQSVKGIGNLIAGVTFNVELPFTNVIQSSGTLQQMNQREDVNDQRPRSLPRSEDMTKGSWLHKELSQIVNDKKIERTQRQTINDVTLCFKSSSKERKFRRLEDRSYPSTVLCSLVLLVLSMAVQAVVLPRTLLLLVLFVVGFTWISVLLILILGYRIKCIQRDLRRQSCLRSIFSLITILFVFALSYMNVLCCRNGLLFPDVDSASGHVMAMAFNSDFLLDCDVPHYIYLAAIITLLSVTLFVKISAVVKLVIWLVIAAAYAVVIEFVDRPLFVKMDAKLSSEVPTDAAGILMLIHFVMALYVASRDMEWTLRLRFLWNQKVSQQQQELKDVFEANRLLVLNLLPDHVTPFFQEIRSKNITDLYCQSHSHVVVSFLKIVNLTDAYSPSKISSKMESLRFLNDVITALDKLMDDQRYKTICKIKSFGTSYLTAAGLQTANKTDETEDWRCRQHLTSQIEFIFDAMETVAQRDASLLLRAGISIGPVVAGVVGAKKPQYDIWGETVNIANKLENAGLPNCIQVTEKIFGLLKMKYQFHCLGQFRIPGKPGTTTYVLPGRSTKHGSLPINSQPQQLANKRNSFPLIPSASLTPLAAEALFPKQLESSSYEFTSNSSVVSSSKEFQQVAPPEAGHQQPPHPSLLLKDNSFQVAKMTPPSSLGRRRPGTDDNGGEGQKKSTGRPPLAAFNFLPAPANSAKMEGDASPDLPVFHYRNVVGLGSGGMSENTLTQSQILQGSGNGVGGSVQRQPSDSSTRSHRPPSVVLVPSSSSSSSGHHRNSARSSIAEPVQSSRRPSFGEDRRHQELPKTNPSPSKNSCSSQSSSSKASFSHRPNNQLPPEAMTQNGSSDSYLEGRRLNKMETDDIDKIMEEFLTDIERKHQVIDNANHSEGFLYNQHPLMQDSASSVHQQRPVAPGGKQSSKIWNLPNGKNGLSVYAEELLQPAVEASVVGQVKNAPRVSLSQLTYSTPVGGNWQETQAESEKVALSNMRPMFGEIYSARTPSNAVKDGLLVRRLPPPQPAPEPLPGYGRNFTQGLGTTTTVASNVLPPPRFSINNYHLPVSRPVSLYSAVRPGRTSYSQPPLRPPSFSFKKPDNLTRIPALYHAPITQSKRHSTFVVPPLRHARSLENIASDGEDRPTHNPRPSNPSGAHQGRSQFRGQGLLLPDNVSLSSYSGSEMSRSDPALSYDSSSAIESEYDNYRPGMASDEDYFILEPISDIDLDLFDDIDVDNVQVSENFSSSYIPMLQKMITDV